MKRSEGRRAVEARWEKAGKGLPKATHEGELTIGEIRCAVLENKTRVLTQAIVLAGDRASRQSQRADRAAL